MTLGDKIQLCRKKKGMSQEDLANLLNVSRQAVQKWESGSSNPELSKLTELSNIFDVSLDWLVKDIPERKEEKVKEESTEQSSFPIAAVSRKLDKSTFTLIKVWIIIGMILSPLVFTGQFFLNNPTQSPLAFLGLLEYAITIPFGCIAISKLKTASEKRSLIGWGIITMLLVSFIGGLLILCIKDDKFLPCQDSAKPTNIIVTDRLIEQPSIVKTDKTLYIQQILREYNKTKERCFSKRQRYKIAEIKNNALNAIDKESQEDNLISIVNSFTESLKAMSPHTAEYKKENKRKIIIASIAVFTVLVGVVTAVTLVSIFNQTFDVSFRDGDDVIIATKKVKYNNTVDAMGVEIPTKTPKDDYTYYRFEKWDYDFNTKITSSIDIYPLFSLESLPEGTSGAFYTLKSDYYSVSYFGNAQKLIIPSSYNGLPVREIGSISGNMQELFIPDSIDLYEKGNIPIQNCPQLSKIEFENINVEIPWFYFTYNCPKIKSFTINNQSPLYKVINDCMCSADGSILYKVPSGKEGLFISNSCPIINSGAFSNCNKITKIEFNGVTQSLKSQAVYDCELLNSVTFGKNVKIIDSGNFGSCPLIEEYNVDSDNMVFSSKEGILYSKDGSVLCLCPHMYSGEFVVDSTVVKIGEMNDPSGSSVFTALQYHTFSECQLITSIIIPDTVTTIVDSAFFHCESLEEITLSKNIGRIGNHLFTGCKALVSVIIPQGVSSIAGFAFNDCTSLTYLEIPSTVTILGVRIFTDCTLLKTITFKGTVTQWVNMNKDDTWNEGSSITSIRCSNGTIVY